MPRLNIVPSAAKKIIMLVAAAAILLFILSPKMPLQAGYQQQQQQDQSVIAASAHGHSPWDVISEKLSTEISEAASAAEPESMVVPETPDITESLDLKFLIPLTSSHFNFCRSLYTALINDYPPPTLINWGKVFTDPRRARVEKVVGIDEYLQQLRPNQYALIMDGFDVWYQLPYRDLISHFLTVTEPNGHNMAVFGADKKCWPNHPDSPACVNVPLSTMPKSAYGPYTDGRKIFPDPSEAFTFNRPRWLNSGNMIGPVSVLRQIYDRANQSISQASQSSIKSDQLYIAEIFGQQELNMTVDYQSELFQTMTFSHTDIMFLEDDVFTYPRKSPSQRRMYAVNKISGAVPPVLHFNGPKEAMHEWWPKMWWARMTNDPAVLEKSERIYRSGGACTTDGEFISWHDLCGNADVNDPPEYKDAV